MKARLFFAVCLIVGSAAAPPATAYGADSVPANDPAKVQILQARCDLILPNLRRLHTSDALLRVNVGQAYSGISNRLMSKLNSRLALNKIDSSKFVSIANDYELARKEFSGNYNEYEKKLDRLIKTDCKDKAEEFYDRLEGVREARLLLKESTDELSGLVTDYRVEVEKLRKELINEAKDSGADKQD